MDRCLQASSLQDFVSSQLTTSERIAFERHLQSCAGCKQAVAALLQALPKTVSLDGHASGERVVPRATVPDVDALRREASVLRALSHPGIVSLLDEGNAQGSRIS